MDFELPTPDISWDLNRLGSVLPTEIFSQPPSPAVTVTVTDNVAITAQQDDNRSASVVAGVVASKQDSAMSENAYDPVFSPLGIGILAVLGSTFLIACYIIFVKSDGPEKVKKSMEKQKEKRTTKKNALCEKDDTKRMEDQDYCYDLQDITVDCDSGLETEIEEGIEVSHTIYSPVRGFHNETESAHDSEQTKKVSNRKDDPIIFTLANNDDEMTDCQGSRMSNSQFSSPASIVNILPKATTGGDLPLVDRFPSTNKTKSMTDKSSRIFTLPSISESLSPPKKDTPHIMISSREIIRPDAPGRVETDNSKV